MSRVRKQLITNLYIKDKDIKKLANGYVVYKRANKHAHALIPKARAEDTAKAKILLKKIAYHKAQLEKLGVKGVIPKLPELMRVKHQYTKKQLDHWAKGGNIAKYNASGKNRWKKEGVCSANDTTNGSQSASTGN
jgi:hypothetical protein